MPILENVRYELFAQGLARATNPSEAYIQAGFESQSPESQSSNASRLAADPRIQARVMELRERAAKRSELKHADVLGMIMEDRELARQLGQTGTSLRAAELIGRQIGMFVERKEIKTGMLDGFEPEQLDAIREAAITEAARRIAEGGGGREAVSEDTDVLSRDRSPSQEPLSKAS